MAKYFYDTKALMRYYKNIEDKFIISSITLNELEGIKYNPHVDDSDKHTAEKVINFLYSNNDLFDTISINSDIKSMLVRYGMDNTPDNLICACVKYISDLEDDIIFYSESIYCREIAKSAFHLKINTHENIPIYKGYKNLYGSTEDINDYLINKYKYEDWYENEYLVGYNTDTKSEFEMVYRDNKFNQLKLPNSDFIKGMNALQRCGLDALYNRNIPIVAILGGYGSGKTYLCMKMAYYAVEKSGEQSKILGVRSPVGEGVPVGYLKGDLNEKIDKFFTPLEQQLDNGFQGMERLRDKGVFDVNIPFYLKGMSYHYTVMVVDECEDFTYKELKLVGTRLAEGSRIFFAGDYNQSTNVNYIYNSPLVKMVNELKGNKLFATIYLDEDVRSSASKIFANL